MTENLNFPPETYFARVQQNEQMISVESLSGYRRALPEDDAVSFFDLDVSDEALGTAVMMALKQSRFVNPQHDLDFFKADRFGPLAMSRQRKIIKRSKFKSYRRTYQNMRYLDLEKRCGKIFILPNQRKGGEFWVEVPDQQIVIPGNSDAEQLGAAVRLGFSRCPPIP